MEGEPEETPSMAVENQEEEEEPPPPATNFLPPSQPTSQPNSQPNSRPLSARTASSPSSPLPPPEESTEPDLNQTGGRGNGKHLNPYLVASMSHSKTKSKSNHIATIKSLGMLHDLQDYISSVEALAGEHKRELERVKEEKKDIEKAFYKVDSGEDKYLLDFNHSELSDMPPKLRAVFEENRVLKEKLKKYKGRNQESENELTKRQNRILVLEDSVGMLKQQLQECSRTPEEVQTADELSGQLQFGVRRIKNLEHEVEVLQQKIVVDARLAFQDKKSAAREKETLKRQIVAGNVELDNKNNELRAAMLELRRLNRKLAPIRGAPPPGAPFVQASEPKIGTYTRGTPIWDPIRSGEQGGLGMGMGLNTPTWGPIQSGEQGGLGLGQQGGLGLSNPHLGPIRPGEQGGLGLGLGLGQGTPTWAPFVQDFPFAQSPTGQQPPAEPVEEGGVHLMVLVVRDEGIPLKISAPPAEQKGSSEMSLEEAASKLQVAFWVKVEKHDRRQIAAEHEEWKRKQQEQLDDLRSRRRAKAGLPPLEEPTPAPAPEEDEGVADVADAPTEGGAVEAIEEAEKEQFQGLAPKSVPYSRTAARAESRKEHSSSGSTSSTTAAADSGNAPVAESEPALAEGEPPAQSVSTASGEAVEGVPEGGDVAEAAEAEEQLASEAPPAGAAEGTADAAQRYGAPADADAALEAGSQEPATVLKLANSVSPVLANSSKSQVMRAEDAALIAQPKVSKIPAPPTTASLDCSPSSAADATKSRIPKNGAADIDSNFDQDEGLHRCSATPTALDDSAVDGPSVRPSQRSKGNNNNMRQSMVAESPGFFRSSPFLGSGGGGGGGGGAKRRATTDPAPLTPPLQSKSAAFKPSSPAASDTDVPTKGGLGDQSLMSLTRKGGPADGGEGIKARFRRTSVGPLGANVSGPGGAKPTVAGPLKGPPLRGSVKLAPGVGGATPPGSILDDANAHSRPLSAFKGVNPACGTSPARTALTGTQPPRRQSSPTTRQSISKDPYKPRVSISPARGGGGGAANTGSSGIPQRRISSSPGRPASASLVPRVAELATPAQQHASSASAKSTLPASATTGPPMTTASPTLRPRPPSPAAAGAGASRRPTRNIVGFPSSSPATTHLSKEEGVTPAKVSGPPPPRPTGSGPGGRDKNSNPHKASTSGVHGTRADASPKPGGSGVQQGGPPPGMPLSVSVTTPTASTMWGQF
eukprot:gene31451-6632_t